jgi:hypothetical protein
MSVGRVETIQSRNSPPAFMKGEKMKLKINRYSMEVIPENSQDEAYLEEVLGLKDEKSEAWAIRVNAMGLSCWAYMEIIKK